MAHRLKSTSSEFLAILWLLLFVLAFYVFYSHQEAAAYNRLTGGSATTWDAMWTQLRVVGSPDE